MLSRAAAQTQQTERHGQLVHVEVFRWLATASMVEADIRAPNDNINFNHHDDVNIDFVSKSYFALIKCFI